MLEAKVAVIPRKDAARSIEHAQDASVLEVHQETTICHFCAELSWIVLHELDRVPGDQKARPWNFYTGPLSYLPNFHPWPQLA